MKGGIALLLMFIGFTVAYLVIVDKLPATSGDFGLPPKTPQPTQSQPTTVNGGGPRLYKSSSFPAGVTLFGV